MSTSRFTPANHLLPTLFDRLCDNAPYQKIDRDISVTCGEAIIFTLIRDDEKMAQTQQWRGLRKILRILHSARENDLKMIFLH